jgi:4-hydroxybenzoate polyprenyltransferase
MECGRPLPVGEKQKKRGTWIALALLALAAAAIAMWVLWGGAPG